MNTQENNKLIAEFMEAERVRNGYNYPRFGWFHESELMYDHDWSWLMPVIEKIESTESPSNFNTVMDYPFCFSLKGSDAHIYIDNDCMGSAHYFKTHTPTKERPLTKLQTIYNAAVEFIKWYNQQPK